MKYYSREGINYSRDRKITCGNEILLAGIQCYSRKWIITRGKFFYSRERIITRGNLFITRGNDILLAGEKYWQYMAPEGFRTYGLDFGLQLRHLRDEYTRKEVGDYYAAMCPISHNISLRLDAVVNRWTKRVTWGLIGRVRSAKICGGRKLHKYVSTNVWTMKNVSTQQMSRSVRYMTLQSGTVALRWLFSCWNTYGQLSRD